MSLGRCVTSLVVLVGIVGGWAGGQPRGRPLKGEAMVTRWNDQEEAAVRAVVAQFAESWNRHDMPAMHALDTEDVEWINVAGNHWQGKAMVYKGHAAIHRTIYAKNQMSIEGVTVRSLAPGAAVAVATMRFGPSTGPSGQSLGELKTRGSFILVKRSQRWKIAHFQNTIVDPDAEKHDPATWDDTGYLPGREGG